MTSVTNQAGGAAFDPKSIDRPDPALMKYYLLVAACTVAGFPFVIWPFLFKYQTLRYKFDDKGVSMAWGLLFKKEVYLTFRRIQDIHVTRNLFHRWLGLAEVAVQTASGASGAEMTIEGIRHPEALRDFLYSKMRGVGDEASDETATAQTIAQRPQPTATHRGIDASTDQEAEEDALVILREIRDSLREVRVRLDAGRAEGGP